MESFIVSAPTLNNKMIENIGGQNNKIKSPPFSIVATREATARANMAKIN